MEANQKAGVGGLSHESDSRSSSTEEAGLPTSYSSHANLFAISVVKDVLHSSSAGILFLTGTETTSEVVPVLCESRPPEENKKNPKTLLRCVSAGQFERSKLPLTIKLNVGNRLQPTPEILVSSLEEADNVDDNAVNLRRSKRSLSHSSGSVEPPEEGAESNLQRASSETSLGNQANVHLKNPISSELNAFTIGANVFSNVKLGMGNLLTSPTSGKGNPLALFAKGVQNIGATFDSRKKPLETKKEISSAFSNTTKLGKKEDELSETERLCSTRIIHL